MAIRTIEVGTGITKRIMADLSEASPAERHLEMSRIIGEQLSAFDDKIRENERWARRLMVSCCVLDNNALARIDPDKYGIGSDKWYAAAILKHISEIRLVEKWFKDADAEMKAGRHAEMNMGLAICAAVDLGAVIKEREMKSRWEGPALNGVEQAAALDRGRSRSQNRAALREGEIRDFYQRTLTTHPESSPKVWLRLTIEHFNKLELARDATLPKNTRASRVHERIRKQIARALKLHTRA